MSRPFTDITTAVSGNPVKNGTIVVNGYSMSYGITYDRYVQEYPTISDIDDKYGYRFYNGIFVELVGDQTVVGG